MFLSTRSFAQQRQSFEISKTFFGQSNTDYTRPKISPDGQYFIVTREGGYGIYVFDVQTGSLITTHKADYRVGYSAYWSDDSKVVLYKQRENFQSKVFGFEPFSEQKTVTEIPIYAGALQSYAQQFSKQDKNLIYVNTNTLQLEKMNLFTEAKTSLTNDAFQYYNPILSSGNHLVANRASSMILLNVENQSRENLGQGIPTTFNASSNKLYYFLDLSEDGHHITASDIYVYDLLSQTHTNLTQTNDLIELWPSISADESLLMYEDLQNHQIHLVELDNQ